MLEDILKKVGWKVLPLALSSTLLSFLPHLANAYTNKVSVYDKEKGAEVIEVEVSKDKGIIQVMPRKNWPVTEKAILFSTIKHQKALLKRDIGDLEYKAIRIAQDCRNESRLLSKKVNKLADWSEIEKIKINPYFFVLHGLPVKWEAYKEVKDVRKEAKDFLKGVKTVELPQPLTHLQLYSKILYHREIIQTAKKYLQEVRDSTEIDPIPFSLSELSELERQIKYDTKYLNGKRFEKNAKKIRDRITSRVKKRIKGL